MEYGFKATFTKSGLSYFWVWFEVLRLTLMKCTDLRYRQSLIAKLAPMKILDMEKLESIQKKQSLTGISHVGA